MRIPSRGEHPGNPAGHERAGPQGRQTIDTPNEIRSTIHELNNALTRILTSAELIASDPHGKQTEADADTIRAAALDGRELVAKLQRCLTRNQAQ